jgi:Lrp/AsnC family transcriptional regulator, leucine-responsive regulatory protein
MNILMESNSLDAIDLKILRLLVADGRMSIQALADSAGMSPTPVARRLKRMEQNDIITGYTAMINEAALGFSMSVFVSVKLDKQIDTALENFERAVRDFPEIVDCWLMTGNRDYLMRISTKDLIDFENFLVGKLTKVNGVASIESSIPLRRIKSSGARTP